MTTYNVNDGAPNTSTSYNVSGSAGAGFLDLPNQSSTPSTHASSLKLYTDSSNKLSWVDTAGYKNSLGTANTASRTWTLPDITGTILTDNSTATLSGKTIPSSTNIVDANKLIGTNITGTYATGDTVSYAPGGWQPLTLSAVAPINYNSGAISASVGTIAGTLTAGDDPRLSCPRVIRVKASNAGADEFTSIAAAIGSIVGSSSSNRILVQVHPGIYVEPSITIPPYVTLAGSGTLNTIIVPNSNAITLLTLSSNVSIRDVTLSGLAGTIDIALQFDSVVNIIIRNIIVRNFSTLCHAKATASPCDIIMFSCVFTGTFTKGFHFDGRTIMSSFAVKAILNSIACEAPSTSTPFHIEGPYANVGLASVQINGGNNGIYIADGSVLNTSNSQINGAINAINAANVGAAPLLQIVSTSIFSSVSLDLIISHPSTYGVFSGIAEQTKVVVDTSSSLSLFYTGKDTPGSVIVGNLYYGPSNGTNVTEIGEMITYASPLGLYYGGNVIAEGGTSLIITAGCGYIRSGDFPLQTLVKVQWGDRNIILTNDEMIFIYMNQSGLQFSGSLPDGELNILIARARATAGEIEFVDVQKPIITHLFNKYLQYSRYIDGPLFHSGGEVTANASRQLSVEPAEYYYLNNVYETQGGNTIKWISYYHSGGEFTRSSETEVSNDRYDDGNDLVGIPNGEYVKHSFYTVGEGDNEKYFLVYGQTTFADLDAAQSGDLPTPPNYFEQGVIPLAAIIVLGGDPLVQLIMNITPRIGAAAASSASVTSHSDLLGLADDDHLQYLLVNGDRAMSGTLNMSSNTITNAGTINNVNITTHNSRHLPNGADPLTTAAPLTTLASGITNTVGTANSLARSDHTHAVDVTGYNINTLSNTLGVPKGGTGLATLTASRFVVGNGTSAVDLTKVVPTGAVVGTTDSQTLTAKTIIGGTGSNDIAANKILGVTVNATAPTANQTIIASSGTAAAWGTLTETNFSGTLPVSKGGTGASTLTASRFVVGNGTSIVDLTKVVPTGVVVGTTDSQTLTAKTIIGGTGSNDIAANKILGVTVNATAPTSTQVLMASSGTAAAWTSIDNSSFTGVLSVPKGGTGASALTASRFVVGNGTSIVDLTKVVPTGVVVGTTDSQTLTNKNLVDDSTFIIDSVDNTKRIGFNADGVGTTMIRANATGSRTVILPDADDTIVARTTSDTLTNKTVSSSANTITVTSSPISGVNINALLNQDVRTSASPTFIAVSTDTINEKTANAGVTIDSVLLKDNSVSANTVNTNTIAPLVPGNVSIGYPKLTNVSQDETSTKIIAIDATTDIAEWRTGPAGAIIGTSDTQTMSNKTFSNSTNFSAGLTSGGSVNITDAGGNTLYVNKVAPYSSNTIDMTPSTVKAAIVGTTALNNGTLGDIILVPATSGGIKTMATVDQIHSSADFVDVTTNQTINGTKTFTLPIMVSGVAFVLKTAGGVNLTMPAVSGTIAVDTNMVTTNTTQTISGQKTFSTAPVISSIIGPAANTLTIPNATSTLATTSDLTDLLTTNTAQTISAVKTFSAAPVINTLTSGAFTLTMPSAQNDTVAGIATTQTFSNKTINSTNGNIVDATKINGVAVSGAASASAQLLRYNGTAWVPFKFAYGGIETTSANSSNTSISGTNVFTQINGNVFLSASAFNFAMPSNGILRCDQTGIYVVSYGVNINESSSNTSVAAVMYLNGSQVARTTSRGHLHTAAGQNNLTNNFVISLTSGDQLTMRVATITATVNLTVSWYNIYACQIA